MKNFKVTINTDNITERISMNVKLAIRDYENNDESYLWKANIRNAYAMIITLLTVGAKKGTDYLQSYDELVHITGLAEVFKYRDIALYVNSLLR